MIRLIKSLFWILNHPNNKGKIARTISRLVWWKVNQLVFKLPAVIDIGNNAKYVAYPDSSFGGLVVYTKLPEYYEMKYFTNLIEKDDVVVDVGAHMGDYTVLAGSKLKTGKVLAFEPSTTALKVLEENIHLNRIQDKVIVFPYLASNKNGTSMYIEGNTSETGHISSDIKDKSTRLKTLKLDSVLNKMRVKSVKIVKVDVEGASHYVLQGMADYMSKKIIKNMIIEVNVDSLEYGIKPDETLNFIRSFGYKLFIFNNNGKLVKLDTYPFDKKYINVIAKF